MVNSPNPSQLPEWRLTQINQYLPVIMTVFPLTSRAPVHFDFLNKVFTKVTYKIPISTMLTSRRNMSEVEDADFLLVKEFVL